MDTVVQTPASKPEQGTPIEVHYVTEEEFYETPGCFDCQGKGCGCYVLQEDRMVDDTWQDLEEIHPQ